MNIPFSPPYIDEDVIAEVTDSLWSGWITTGPKVKALEDLVAETTTVPAALGVNSATSGLMLALHWYGVSRGDEVIIPAYTYAATALAVMHLGAKPVMIDSADDLTMDPAQIAAAVTERTKAIIPVDIGGLPCDYVGIHAALASKEVRSKFRPSNEVQKLLGRLLILSDSAHSIGSTYQKKATVLQSDLSVFSLHAVKNVTSAEGGMILINMPTPFDNAEVYKTLRLWALNGQTKDAFTKTKAGSWRYDIVYPGFKMNLPDVLAAIALAQLRKYDDMLLVERKRVHLHYARAFAGWAPAQNPVHEDANRESSYHLYALRINGINEEQRDRIIQHISDSGVAVNVHFQPLPILKVFKDAGYSIEDYPNAWDSYSREISLPIYPQLTDEQVDRVVKAVIEAYTKVVHD